MYDCEKCFNKDTIACDNCCMSADTHRPSNFTSILSFEPYKKEIVNHPDHYQGVNECIDVMEAMFGIEAVKHFCMCNAYKYRFRSNKKNGEEDIKKAEWYETKLIELNNK